MNAPKTPMSRLEIMVVIMIVMEAAALLVGILDLYNKYSSPVAADRTAMSLHIRPRARSSKSPIGSIAGGIMAVSGRSTDKRSTPAGSARSRV